jgi:hypothetical protein
MNRKSYGSCHTERDRSGSVSPKYVITVNKHTHTIVIKQYSYDEHTHHTYTRTILLKWHELLSPFKSYKQKPVTSVNADSNTNLGTD